MWTKTSAPPLSGWMKPKPFVALNHFTVPVAMEIPFRRHVPRRSVRPRDQIVGEKRGEPGSSIRRASVESNRFKAIFDPDVVWDVGAKHKRNPKPHFPASP